MSGCALPLSPNDVQNREAQAPVGDRALYFAIRVRRAHIAELPRASPA